MSNSGNGAHWAAVQDVFVLDGIVRSLEPIRDGMYKGLGFRYKDWFWVEPGAIVVLVTDAPDGPVVFADWVVELFALAPYVLDGQIVGVVISADGALVRKGERLGWVRAKARQGVSSAAQHLSVDVLP
jgi:hypothetical protein